MKGLITNKRVAHFFLVLITSCTEQSAHQPVDQGPVFNIVSPEHSGVYFVNELPETNYLNGFLYEYFYNGGGVAVADFNNDGLEDLYFVSNLNDNKLYLNRGGLVFEDITAQSKANGEKGWSNGVSIVDINQDGWLDIYVCRSGAFTDAALRKNQLFINSGIDSNGVPAFEEQADAYGIDDDSYGIQSAFFDYDLDGDLDLFLANHNRDAPQRSIEKVIELHQTPSPEGGNKLYKNNGQSFEDVSIEAGFISNMMNYTLGVSISDINDDGWPDIYLANDYSEPDYLYLNRGDGTFYDVAGESFGHMPNSSMGCDIADVNNDGLLDIMSLDMAAADNFGIKTSMSAMDPAQFEGHVKAGFHRQYMFNALQLNNGDPGKGIPVFSEIGQLSGVSSTDWSWSVLVADFDNDGYKDMFITNGVKRDFINNDFNTFLNNQIEKIKSRRQDPLNYFAELTQAAPTREKINYLYKNNGDLTFTDVSKKWGLTDKSLSNGAAYADLDNDGDLDLVVNNIDAQAQIMENKSNQHQMHYLAFQLKGPLTNRNGIGAKVTIEYNGGLQILENNPTRGYLSSVSHQLHFGLGSHQWIDRIKINWPDGKVQELDHLQADQVMSLDYQNAKTPKDLVRPDKNHLFTVIPGPGIDFKHVENKFDDFERESLLPYRMSQQGPALAVADINGDGLDDFYVGGALGYSGAIYLQNRTGEFTSHQSGFWNGDKKYEDVDARFFDADGDADMDLLVVSGGNEYEQGSAFYRSRFYENTGGGIFKRSMASGQLPMVSGSVVRTADFDNDGDVDFFLGGRQIPGMYPFPASSFLFRNDSKPGEIRFTDVTELLIGGLENIGMVTDAVWTDLNGDSLLELVVCGEWMGLRVFSYGNSGFEDISSTTGLERYTGWWYSVESGDMDNDGDNDLIAGNFGLNSKYKATEQEPFQIYTTDFDNNGTYDIVLGYYNEGELFPLRGRECTSNQMPFVKNKFPSYESFGRATLYEVYGFENLSTALHYQVNTFANTYFENKGDHSFEATPLDNLAQISTVKTILVNDFDEDGKVDILLAGNLYETEVETPRNDASFGLYLSGDGHGKFTSLTPWQSGLYLNGDVKKGVFIELINEGKCILFARNGAELVLVRINGRVPKE